MKLSWLTNKKHTDNRTNKYKDELSTELCVTDNTNK